MFNSIKIIKEIWRQKRASIFILIMASICLLINKRSKLEQPYYSESDGWEHLAYLNAGEYWTDYGIGYAFDCICYKSFSIAEYSDGTL